MDATALLTIAAILVGPMFAIFITLWRDTRKEKHDRRMDVFKTLMRTRRTPINPEHVGALNLIEFEFSNDQDVMKWWKQLFEHFGTEHARSDTETPAEHASDEERGRRDQKFYERLSNERQRLLTKLLHAMARALNFNIEQLEIFEGGYTPQGWFDIELEQRAIRQFAVDLYLGRKALPIAVLDFTKVDQQQKLEHNTDTQPINEMLEPENKTATKAPRKK